MLNPRCQGADPGHVRRQVSERQGPASRRRGDAGGWDTSANTQGGSGRRPARAGLGEPAAGAASPAGQAQPVRCPASAHGRPDVSSRTDQEEGVTRGPQRPAPTQV